MSTDIVTDRPGGPKVIGDIVTRAADNRVLTVEVDLGSLTATEVQDILDQHRPWVPLPDGPTEAHVGKRLRRVLKQGDTATTTTEFVLKSLTSAVAYVHQLSGLMLDSGDWFVHPDDVPVDPDAALVERMADRFQDEWLAKSKDNGSHRELLHAATRAALAVVRESEAAS